MLSALATPFATKLLIFQTDHSAGARDVGFLQVGRNLHYFFKVTYFLEKSLDAKNVSKIVLWHPSHCSKSQGLRVCASDVL